MVQAYHCSNKGEILSPYTYEKPALGPYDIFVKISHCGLCHSDIHLIDDDWKITKFPLVPGHEIIGTVEEKGPAVDFLKIGDRIGIGWQGKSCMACEWCLQGDENLCAKEEDTCVGHFGGFAKEIVADGRFAFVIPEALPSAETAPLLCGGATVFAPLIEHKIAPTMKVAVLGIGGLGHLAIQFVRALGCEVTAISHSADKENDAKKFGAHHFIHVKDSSSYAEWKNSFDFILSATSTGLDWVPVVEMLRPRGNLCLLGGLEINLELPIINLFIGRKLISCSNVASRPIQKKMLNFAALHNILPQIEEFPMGKVNEAIAKLRAGKIRYRAVLSNS